MTAGPAPADQTARPGRRLTWLIAGSVVAGLLLLGAVVTFACTRRTALSDTLRYSRLDIAVSQPMLAVHEMDVPGTNASHPIPFLPSGGPQPKIVVPQRFFDFGSVGTASVLQHSFLIINDGTAPLTISRAYTTCGCTLAELTSSVIPAGEAARVTISFDAGMHPDAAGTTIRRALIVENNDPLNSRVEIWIQATVRAGP